MAKKRSSKKTTKKAGAKSKKNVRKVTAKKRSPKTKSSVKAKAKAPAAKAKKPRARKRKPAAVVMPVPTIEPLHEVEPSPAAPEAASPAQPEIETHEAVVALAEEAVSVAIEALTVVLPRDEHPASDDESKDAEAA